MEKYILIDGMNMFHRGRHVVRGSIDMKIGMTLSILFNAINRAYKDFNGTHTVLCLEGSSWRKKVYPPYKRNRVEKREKRTLDEVAEDEMFMEAYEEFCEFMKEKTNCTILQHKECEADDFIARWIQLHPNDDHIIVSTDSDFYQLLAPNVSQYNGVQGHHITLDGIIGDNNKPVKDKKSGKPKMVGDPEWLLFEKCVRGDKSDNIFSAYPGARVKSTRNKIGMMEAFADRQKQGFSWNNFMLQRWTDHEGNEVRVMDAYNRNVELVDLTAQPDHIKAALDETIIEAVQRDPVPQVGMNFMRFCGKHQLIRVSDNAEEHAMYLKSTYKK